MYPCVIFGNLVFFYIATKIMVTLEIQKSVFLTILSLAELKFNRVNVHTGHCHPAIQMSRTFNINGCMTFL